MEQRLLLLLFSLLLATNSQATITCSKEKLSKPVSHDFICHFKVIVTCELVDENINFKSLKDSYLSDVVKKGSQFKVHEQSDHNNQKGMTGYLLAVTQSFTTQYGAMSVRANIIIADDQEKTFYYELRSKSISGKGDTKYNKSILNITTLKILPNKSKLTLIKEIDVEQPWYAPDSMFFDMVESELEDSIRKSAPIHAHKICGENVDALRQ